MENVQDPATSGQINELRLSVIRAFDKVSGRLTRKMVEGSPCSSAALDRLLEQLLVQASFGKLDTIKPLADGESVKGKIFVERSREKAKTEGKTTLDEEAYNFYKKPENWHLMPDEASGIDVVVFVEAQFGSGGDRYVRCLFRHDAEWVGRGSWLSYDFNSPRRVAVSQVSAQTSGS